MVAAPVFIRGQARTTSAAVSAAERLPEVNEQVQACSANGGQFVGPAPDLLIARDDEPAAAADFGDPLHVRRVGCEMVAVGDEGNTGRAQCLIEHAAPGVAIDEE